MFHINVIPDATSSVRISKPHVFKALYRNTSRPATNNDVGHITEYPEQFQPNLTNSAANTIRHVTDTTIEKLPGQFLTCLPVSDKSPHLHTSLELSTNSVLTTALEPICASEPSSVSLPGLRTTDRVLCNIVVLPGLPIGDILPTPSVRAAACSGISTLLYSIHSMPSPRSSIKITINVFSPDKLMPQSVLDRDYWGMLILKIYCLGQFCMSSRL